MASNYEDAIIRRDFQLWRCIGSPPAWGQTRQALIGALPWFHNAQSGFSHIKEGIPENLKPACGLLANGYGGDRDYLDTEIAIMSINSAQSTPDTTKTRRTQMQEAIDNHCIIGLIVAKRATKQNAAALGDHGADTADLSDEADDDEDMDTLGQYGDNSPEVFFPGTNINLEDFECFVLGWFLPIQMWPEAVLADDGDTQKFVWMVKLQKENLEQQAWWANSTHPQPPALAFRNFAKLTTDIKCDTCNLLSPRIYHEGPVCLNENCAQGPSHLAGTLMSKGHPLSYSDAFLKERNDPRKIETKGPYSHPQFAESFHYRGPTIQSWTMVQVKEEMKRLLGTAICPNCGMANSRILWTGWTCTNTRCTSPLNLPGCPPDFSLTDVQNLGVPPKNDIFQPRSTLRQLFSTKYQPYYQGPEDTPDFTVHHFKLKDECYVAVMEPKISTNQIQDGSDQMYMRLLHLAAKDSRVDLRRRLVGKGSFLTNHFNQNFGAPYAMAVSAGETSFNEAPPEISAALAKANQWTQPFRELTDPPYNEMYLAGYFHECKMNYHQDGEKGLNDKILTWSLGGCGTFSICVAPNLCRGRDRSGRKWITTDPLVPGCRKYDERVALKRKLDGGDINQDQWASSFKALFKDDKGKEGKVVLELPATHGVLILMHGKDMQRMYQHKMEVHGPLRFALTFRYVGAENQPQPKKRKAEVEADPVAEPKQKTPAKKKAKVETNSEADDETGKTSRRSTRGTSQKPQSQSQSPSKNSKVRNIRK